MKITLRNDCFLKLGLVMALGFVSIACQKSNLPLGVVLSSGAKTQSSSTSPTTPQGPQGTVALTKISGPAAIVSNLGVTNPTILMQVSSDSNFNGPVHISIERDELDLIDVAKSIQINVSPSSTLNLTPTSSAVFSVTVVVPTMAPTVVGSHFHVIASRATGETLANFSVNLDVKAIFDITLKGSTAPMMWNTLTTTSFIKHTEGVMIRFINIDTLSTHVIHSSGPIPHGNTAAPLAKAPAAGQNGGIYAFLVTTQSPVGDTYYCHDVESGANARTLIFNAAPVFTPPTNPDASFANYIKPNILTPKCLNCHGTSGGFSFDTYGNTIRAVTMGSALGSPLYNSILSGSMPVGGPPLSARDLAAVRDWINGGAPNN